MASGSAPRILARSGGTGCWGLRWAEWKDVVYCLEYVVDRKIGSDFHRVLILPPASRVL